MQIPPEFAEYLRKMEQRSTRVSAQLDALTKRYTQIASQFEDSKIEQQKLREALKKASKRIRYIEDIPGKRVPYFQNFSIEIPAPQSPSQTLANTQLSDTKQISQDGPFVCTTYLGAFLMKTYSIGPYGDEESGRPNDPPAGTEVITPLTGRFRPIASTADPFAGAYIGVQVGSVSVAGAQAVQTMRPGTADFLFEIQDNSVDRNRQNQIPIPSRFLFSEFDRPLYLPVADFFERGSTITWKATLTHELGFVELNYAQLENGFAEGLQQPPPDPAVAGDIGRVPCSVGGTLYLTMLGYKILQAQSPAV